MDRDVSSIVRSVLFPMECLPQDLQDLKDTQKRIEEKLDLILALLNLKTQEKPKSVAEVVVEANSWLKDI